MDAKADRKQKVMIVHNPHFEPVELSEANLNQFIKALKSFVRFNQCRDITFVKTNNQDYLEVIQRSFIA